MNAKRTILLVEDEESLRSVMKQSLLQHGFAVDVAVDGEEGLAAVRAGRADLVLLDVILPKMDGFEILNALTMAEKRKAPIILFSVSTEPLPPEKLKELGVADWIVKSDINPNDVVHIINQHLA